MGREKNRRKLNFKPVYKEFTPLNIESTGTTSLLHEEIEAIYLMDVLSLYQEEAAISMEVSRPTFTRILKNARKKLAIALISGHKLHITDNNENYVVAICSDDTENFTTILPTDKYIVFFKLENEKLQSINFVINPVDNIHKKPANTLPKILVEHNVNIFISSKIGEGLKNSLISKGIKPIQQDKFSIKDFNL